MPRASRYFLPGHVWHITHRCHKKEFLLKFARDRRAWVRWLFEAKKRYGLCILNYVATSNHVHLLVQDSGRGENLLCCAAAGSDPPKYLNRGQKTSIWHPVLGLKRPIFTMK